MGTVLPPGVETIKPDNTQKLRSAIRTRNGSGFLFLNNYQAHKDMPNRAHLCVRIPLESGDVRIPASGGFGIASGEGAVLLFNLELGGVRIRKRGSPPAGGYLPHRASFSTRHLARLKPGFRPHIYERLPRL
jgi:hypothetical protein